MLKQLLEKKEKKVEYIELIYDLIFVYMVGRNNSLLHNISGGFVKPGVFLAYIFATLAVIQIWNYTTFYINVYGKNKARQYVFLFINMFLIYFMADGTSIENGEVYFVKYHMAWALILINIAVQYLCEIREYKGDEVNLRRIRSMAAIILCESALIGVSMLLHAFFGFMFMSFVAIFFGVFSVLIASRKSCSALVDFNHLSERAMLYVVFTFGEMIIAIASYFEGKFTLNTLYFALMGFLIVVGLFLSYGAFYDHILDREKNTSGVVYIILHIFIIFALNNITTSLEFMRNEEVSIMPKILFLTSSFLMYFIFLISCGVYAKKRAKPTLKIVLTYTLIGLSFAALMIVFRENMYINIALTVAFTFVFFFYINKYKNKILKAEAKSK